MSWVPGFFNEVANEAKVFDRGLNTDEDCCDPWEVEETRDGVEKAGCDAERFADASEACDCDRDDMGTVRLCRLGVEDRAVSTGLGASSSGGT